MPAEGISTAADAMNLGCVLLDDAIRAARDSDDFCLQLDVALGLIERERAGGAGGDPAEFVARAVQIVRGRQETTAWLYGGVARLGWLVTRLGELGKVKAANAGWIDDYVLTYAENYPDALDVDFPEGIIGLGLYGLAHPSPAVRTAITEAVVAVIGERADHDEHGLFLRRVNPRREQVSPGYMIGHRDLGVAHGNLGVAAYLGMVAAPGQCCAGQARALLTPLTRWLLSMAIPGDDTAVFGVTAERRWQSTRAAWCYGDPGASAALALAAGALDDPELAEACRVQARRSAVVSLNRPMDRSGVEDACLCHGAVGLCYFGRKWSDQLGLDSLGRAFAWCTWIRERRTEGRLLYRKFGGWAADASFLEGDSGAASALFYLASGRPPLWEELLLMASPRRG